MILYITTQKTSERFLSGSKFVLVPAMNVIHSREFLAGFITPFEVFIAVDDVTVIYNMLGTSIATEGSGYGAYIGRTSELSLEKVTAQMGDKEKSGTMWLLVLPPPPSCAWKIFHVSPLS